MLQDMPFGRLENEYLPHPPRPDDRVVCVRDNTILIRRHPDDTLTLPRVAQVEDWSKGWNAWDNRALRYAFRMEGHSYYLWMGESGEAGDDFAYVPARSLRQLQSKDICYAAMTAWHIFNWYRANRFCGRCGNPTIHDERERMVRCPHCDNRIYPRINPCVIVGVTDGDRLLLTQYAFRNYAHYALIAGFTEIGETMEQTVAREVMEEVGLKVKNIRYYKSQPWGVDGNVLMGFYCDLDGSDEIHIDENELAMAQWFPRHEIPAKDDGISLTREMIRVFSEGKEPK